MKHLLFFCLLAINFAVNAQSVAPIIGSSHVCISNSITLTDATPGGSWSSSATTAATVVSGTVFGVAAGTTIITYTVGTAHATKVVSVNAGPDVYNMAGGGTFCASTTGLEVTLSGSTVGCTYQLFRDGTTTGPPWSGTGGALDFGTQPSGVYTVSGINTAIGCDRIMSGNATISEIAVPPAISGPTTGCVGIPVSFTDAITGGAWSIGDYSVATINSSGALEGLFPGTSTVYYSVGAGCSVSTTVTVSLGTCSGTPTAGSTVASGAAGCVGNTTNLSLSGSSLSCGLIYQWQSSPDGTTFTNIPGATNKTLAYPLTTSTQFRVKVACNTTGLYSYSTNLAQTAISSITSHSVINTPSAGCLGPDFYITACGQSPSLNVVTFFGDGTSAGATFTPSGTGGSYAHVYHGYQQAGTYSVKQVLYIGGVAQDSVMFSYEYFFCRTLPIKAYFDKNSNCVFDSGDVAFVLPFVTEVDSNGIPVDTICATSGFYYDAHGPVGTVYAFKNIAATTGVHASCPASGIVYDTIQTFVNNYSPKFIGFNCSGTGAFFDIREFATARTGRHTQIGDIYLQNSFCTGEGTHVRLTFSPHYSFGQASPMPSLVADNVATWDVSSLSNADSQPFHINYTLDIPLDSFSLWLLAGDTVNSNYHSQPYIIGDMDTSNNNISRKDTVTASFDPNHISVLPGGYVLPCTKMQYTINFENTGNDTAHNIAVMDTLDDNLDARTLNIDMASSAMNVATIKSGGHSVIRFDFPKINLPDSSHHGQCYGAVMFNIKSKPSIPAGTTIRNYAGIFFDDNPAVMTDTATNIVGLPAVTGPASVCSGATITLASPSGFGGGVWSVAGTSVATVGSTSGIVTGVSASTVAIIYTLSNTCGATSTSKTISVLPLPTSFAVDGGGSFCSGGTGVHIGLGSSQAGINYSLLPGSASLVGTGSALDFGLFTAAGTYTIQATDATSACHSLMGDSAVVTVTPAVVPSVSASASPAGAVCTGVPVTFSAEPVNGGTLPAYEWRVNGVLSASAADYTYSPTNGDVVSVTMISDALCATPVTATYSVTMAVDAGPVPAVNIVAAPGTSISIGDTVTFAAAIIGGGTTATYQWQIDGMNIPGATNATYTNNIFANGDTITCIITTSNICGVVTATAYSVITVTTEGVRQLPGHESVSIFPNPNNGTFTIGGTVGADRSWADITVTNMIGQVVYHNQVPIMNGKINANVQLDKSLARGVYMVTISADHLEKVFHFTVQ